MCKTPIYSYHLELIRQALVRIVKLHESEILTRFHLRPGDIPVNFHTHHYCLMLLFEISLRTLFYRVSTASKKIILQPPSLDTPLILKQIEREWEEEKIEIEI